MTHGPSLQQAGKRVVIGIDPGVTTGVAHWDCIDRRLLSVASTTIHKAMDEVRARADDGCLRLVVFEDARLRTWFGAKGREALQGAGSIKRDSAIWADFLFDLGVPFRQLKPSAGGTKWDAQRFAKLTGWAGRTNEHARDAALLVWGYR